ncbi:hypothetical protein F511_41177 [Dorcoceras hygrometricum]|uniref:Uncharacterized protein n=1 Tax=Dorcoceras hygrometricum TaxID=472368 RepID=A0A2Z7A9H5_9LAMI|nr:hypothetical protein F511_41177 [Dorcoceras hygrometricum]
MVRVQQMKKAAGALSVDDVISSDITISRKQLFTSRWYLELAIAKRCRLHELIRQSFALALKVQEMVCDDRISRFILLVGNQQLATMLAGFTTEEAEADTVADQGLKRVNHIFGGLKEGIWPKTEELTA